jgi:hypothetical protein
MSDRFKKKYGLEEYYSVGEPAIFFGCYSSHTVKRICNHNALAVVVWGGTDVLILKKYLAGPRNRTATWFVKLLEQTHIRHVAISEDIVRDLFDLSLEYKTLPLNGVLSKQFKVCKPGKCLYSYGYTRRPDVYNAKLVKEVLSRLKNVQCLEGEIGTSKTILYDDIPVTYSKCFMGLRLTKHDGLPNTVIELGLMGIRCIHNSNLPNAVKWTGIDDIVTNVRKEQERIGQPNVEIAKAMREYIEMSDDWLTTNYWN